MPQLNPRTTSFLKLEDVGDVMGEAPERTAESILLFCQVGLAISGGKSHMAHFKNALLYSRIWILMSTVYVEDLPKGTGWLQKTSVNFTVWVTDPIVNQIFLIETYFGD